MTLDELRVVITAETSEYKKELDNTKKEVNKFAEATENAVKKMSAKISSEFKGAIDNINKNLQDIGKKTYSKPWYKKFKEQFDNIVNSDSIEEIENSIEVYKKAIENLQSTEPKIKFTGDFSEKQKQAILTNLKRGRENQITQYQAIIDLLNQKLATLKQAQTVKPEDIAVNSANQTSKAAKSTSQWSKAMNQLVQKFSIAQIALKLITKAVQAFIKSIKEGISNLIAFEGENGELSKEFKELKGNLNYLVNSIGASFAPLLETLIPILNNIVSALADFNNQLGEVFAKISGSKEIVKATKQVDEYGNAIDVANRKTLGFDELNKLGDVNGGSFEITENETAGASSLVETLAELSKITEPVFSLLMEVINTVNSLLEGSGENLKETTESFVAILTDVVSLVNNLLKAIGPGLSPVLQAATKAVSKILEIVKKLVDAVVKNIPPSFFQALESLLDAIGSILGSIVDLVFELIEPLEPIVSGVLGFVIQEIADALAIVFEILSPIINLLKIVVDLVVALVGTFNDLFTFNFEHLGKNWIDFGEKVKTSWTKVVDSLKNVWEGFKTFFKNLINGLIAILNGFLNGFIVAINFVIKGLNKISFDVPDWVPGIGGKHVGVNIKELSTNVIPYLAQGGIIDNPTLAMLGEYSGAKNNPEIAAPQSLLENIVNSGNDEVINAMLQIGRQIVTSIENKDLEVSIGDETIASAASRGNQSYFNRTGKPLIPAL